MSISTAFTIYYPSPFDQKLHTHHITVCSETPISKEIQERVAQLVGGKLVAQQLRLLADYNSNKIRRYSGERDLSKAVFGELDLFCRLNKVQVFY